MSAEPLTPAQIDDLSAKAAWLNTGCLELCPDHGRTPCFLCLARIADALEAYRGLSAEKEEAQRLVSALEDKLAYALEATQRAETDADGRTTGIISPTRAKAETALEKLRAENERLRAANPGNSQTERELLLQRREAEDELASAQSLLETERAEKEQLRVEIDYLSKRGERIEAERDSARSNLRLALDALKEIDGLSKRSGEWRALMKKAYDIARRVLNQIGEPNP